jgi:hypothetical protein
MIMATHAQATPILDSKKIRFMFERHLDRALYEYNRTAVSINELRECVRAAFGVNHVEEACAEWRNRMRKEEKALRLQAFDAFIDELQHVTHAADPNMLLPILRRAGIKVRDGDIYWTVAQETPGQHPTEKPALFKPETWELFPVPII